jgi:hypothetical protein
VLVPAELINIIDKPFLVFVEEVEYAGFQNLHNGSLPALSSFRNVAQKWKSENLRLQKGIFMLTGDF